MIIEKKEFTEKELIENPDLEGNLDFYLEQFRSDCIKFSDMHEAQKQQFKETIKDYFYDWLGLTDEIINDKDNGPSILEKLSIFLIKQDQAIYFSDIAKAIVDAHRDKDNSSVVKLDLDIRIKNNNFITATDKEINDLYIVSIQALVHTYNSSCKPQF